MSGVTRCGFAAIIGAPNAGKSTLLNRLAGQKLAIVSPKPQTTRFRVLGIVPREGAWGRAQVLLVDTPGIFSPRRMLDRAMVRAAWTGATDADITLFLVDAERGLADDVRTIAARLREAARPVWLVLNKVDLVSPPKLLPLTAKLNELTPFGETFMISAEKGDGVETLLDRLAAAMPEGPFLYPEDELTDQTDRLLAAEIVREQIFRQTHEEVPYGTTVETEVWEEKPDGSVVVRLAICVAREGQKAIIIGKGGARLKAIGAAARTELAKELERPVHLFLTVLHRPGWDEEKDRLRDLGLEPD
ncbi:GTPase Era [Elioraea rosea]|uniref:GTPase Era n=1 Tax=Elioraea rosea TaxID=2492390 RepID=UPI001184691C|nr:GTPase Era [Elioraea rosea]